MSGRFVLPTSLGIGDVAGPTLLTIEAAPGVIALVDGARRVRRLQLRLPGPRRVVRTVGTRHGGEVADLQQQGSCRRR